MSTRSLIELNHDYTNQIDTVDFQIALQRYLRLPTRARAEHLLDFGVIVHGECHSEDRNTRGFRNVFEKVWYVLTEKRHG